MFQLLLCVCRCSCNLCNKSFNTEEQFTNHQLCHTQDGSRRLLTCDVCRKRFVNNSALACHMKTHSADKYYTCPMCRQGYDMMVELRKHAEVHRVNGVFPCSHCHKSFSDLGECDHVTGAAARQITPIDALILNKSCTCTRTYFVAELCLIFNVFCKSAYLKHILTQWCVSDYVRVHNVYL